MIFGLTADSKSLAIEKTFTNILLGKFNLKNGVNLFKC
jgi:hypothetical protein